MNGLFLALEGMDGAGKSSQISLLAEYFHKIGKHVKTIHFPRLNQKPYGEMIAAYLRGEYGGMATVHPKLSALLFALNRQQSADEIRESVANGRVVLADRYVLSNVAYQRAKIADIHAADEMAHWLESLEFGFLNVPRPDLTLFLDVPPEFSLSRLTADRKGEDREYLQGKEDIHEADALFQRRVRDEYLSLAKQNPGTMGRVDCGDAGGGMADKATIHSRVIDMLRYYKVI
jgi:thymidylate kinase